MVLDLAYSLELPNVFVRQSTSFNHNEFWKHSFIVGYLSRALAPKVISSKEDLEITYLAGLLHDLGILVFYHLLGDEYDEFIRGIRSDEGSLDCLEEHKFGIGHPLLGAKFIDIYWLAASKASHPIRGHHAGNLKSYQGDPISQVIAVANLIANSNSFTNGLPIKSNTLISLNFPNIFGLSKEDYQLLVDNMIEMVRVFENLLKK